MMPSKYTQHLPEVGDPLLHAVKRIDALRQERDALANRMDDIEFEINARETELQSSVTSQWTPDEIEHAKLMVLNTFAA
jgi:hypothetical protein